MGKIRFSLRGAFAIATAVVLLVGLSQARRRSILKEANDLKTDGANFAIDYRWWEKIWVQKPTEAGMVVQLRADGRLAIRDAVYSREDAIARCETLEKRLKNFGVSKVVFIVEKNNDGPSYLVIIPSPSALSEMKD